MGYPTCSLLLLQHNSNDGILIGFIHMEFMHMEFMHIQRRIP